MTKVAFIAPLGALLLSAAMGGCLESENEFEDQHTRFAGTWELQATPAPGGLACDVFDGEVTSWALAASDGHFGRSVELADGSFVLEIKSADETADRLHVQFRKHELWLEQRGGSAEGDYDFDLTVTNDDRIVGKISAHILSGPPVSGDCVMQFTVSGQVIR